MVLVKLGKSGGKLLKRVQILSAKLNNSLELTKEEEALRVDLDRVRKDLENKHQSVLPPAVLPMLEQCASEYAKKLGGTQKTGAAFASALATVLTKLQERLAETAPSCDELMADAANLLAQASQAGIG